jgi:hypothetical protein
MICVLTVYLKSVSVHCVTTYAHQQKQIFYDDIFIIGPTLQH